MALAGMAASILAISSAVGPCDPPRACAHTDPATISMAANVTPPTIIVIFICWPFIPDVVSNATRDSSATVILTVLRVGDVISSKPGSVSCVSGWEHRGERGTRHEHILPHLAMGCISVCAHPSKRQAVVALGPQSDAPRSGAQSIALRISFTAAPTRWPNGAIPRPGPRRRAGFAKFLRDTIPGNACATDAPPPGHCPH